MLISRSLLKKEAILLSRRRWLIICLSVPLVFPLAANFLAANPLVPLDTAFLAVSVSLSCFSGELVFRVTADERRSGTLDVLLTSGACCRLLVLCKICLPALLAVSFTLAGLAANDIAAALITGRTLYSGVFSLRNGLAALFTAVISSSLEIALLLRSRQALPLQSHTALTAALTCLMTVLFAFCGRLSPFLAPAISLPLSFGAVELAARELLSSQGRTRPSGKRPDILRSPSSPAAALALKDLSVIPSWLKPLARYTLLVILCLSGTHIPVPMAAAVWLLALSFGPFEFLFPALVHEMSSGTMDVLRTALGSWSKVCVCKCAAALAISQPAVIAVAVSARPAGAALSWAIPAAELAAALFCALSCAAFLLMHRASDARFIRFALYAVLACIYAAALLVS